MLLSIPLLTLALVIKPPAASLAHFRAFAESAAVRQSWSGTGAVVCGIGGGLAFAGAFYHFTHRIGAVNNTAGNLGGTVVGASFGAAGGALFGAFVGSLIPKHKRSPR